ncbi:MAG: S8 family serine peptidase [Chloroflexota bacterium]
MRRHVATFVAAALLLAAAVGPAAAGSGGFGAAVAGSPRAAGAAGAADPTGRWIVLYKGGTDAAAATARRSARDGFKADRTFTHGIRGFSAALSDAQVETLRGDSAVAAVVPDEKIEVEGQLYPTGISRIGARVSRAARIDGVDDRVDADVAILDTGIARVPELNVVGGYDCSTSNPDRWRDVYGHGTHVAGTVGAIDNGTGVVGVAPGVRLWAVKVIDDSGSGMLSWYACGIDWVFAQHDRNDASRPLIEAVNMSITKWGRDDGACGSANGDFLHAAICRLVKSGVTVVAAAANDSGDAALRVPGSYDEVITVSALADTDGKPGGLGGNRCFSWGSYDVDDTFADFSNYGKDVDLIAPGKCIYSTIPGGTYAYMSGTSMAAPHVTGAAALVKATRPYFTPADVKQALQYLGTLDWRVTTDPDGTHEKLLNLSRLGPRGDFEVTVPTVPTLSTSGGSATLDVTLVRNADSFERITFGVRDVPPGIRAAFADRTLYGFEGTTTTMTLSAAKGLAPGTYHLTVVGDEHGNRHFGIATFTVAGPNVAPPPTTDQSPRGLTDRSRPSGRDVVTGSTGVGPVPGPSTPQPPRTPSSEAGTPDAATADAAGRTTGDAMPAQRATARPSLAVQATNATVEVAVSVHRRLHGRYPFVIGS